MTYHDANYSSHIMRTASGSIDHQRHAERAHDLRSAALLGMLRRLYKIEINSSEADTLTTPCPAGAPCAAA